MDQKVTPKQILAIGALLTTGDVSRAAKAAGVTRKTVHKWLNLPDFSNALEEAGSKAFSDATRRLSGLLGRSVDELEKLLLKGDLTVSERIRVVQIILDVAPRWREMTSFDGRMRRLEEAIAYDH
ncbi:MAG: hypothetical protein IMZ50_02605 [Candidatus Atribacteria bacterium]|nr:hypothetical protein [Candidatus Atribacteria bacterium]